MFLNLFKFIFLNKFLKVDGDASIEKTLFSLERDATNKD